MRSLPQHAKEFCLAALIVIGLGSGASAQTQVVAFGTSFTAGQGVGTSGAYPAVLEQALRAKGYNVTVSNQGVSGDTAVGGAGRVSSSVPNGTALAIVEFGVNEILGKGDVATIAPSIRTIASNLRSRGIKTIFLATRPGAARYMSGLGGPVVQIRLGGNRAENRDERTKHPSATGQAVAMQQMLPAVMAALGKPK